MEKGKLKKLHITIVVFFLIIVTALFIALYLIPGISESLTSTFIADDYSLVRSYTGKALVVRDESCIFTDTGGGISYYVEESEKTRIGTRICDIYSRGNKNGEFCPKTGFVSYYYDGFEDYFTPESILTMDPIAYLDLDAESNSMVKADLQPGDFVYKIVDGSNWYLVLPVNEEQLKFFRIGDNISIILADGTNLNAIAERVLGFENMSVMAKILSYYPDFAKYRNLDAEVIVKKTDGLGIPASAVATSDEKNGVYTLGTDGEFHFRRINILDEQDGMCVVSKDTFTALDADGNEEIIATISLFDEVLRDASEYSE